jgi:hypothetical protein
MTRAQGVETRAGRLEESEWALLRWYARIVETYE